MISQYLRTYTYVDLLDIADYLKFKKPEMINGIGSTGLAMASLTVQDLKLTLVRIPGSDGNKVSVEYVDGGASMSAGQETAAMNGIALIVKMKPGVSTAAQIKAAIEANYIANSWMTVEVTGVATNPQIAQPKTPFAGGVDATGYDGQLFRRLVRLANAACEWVEKEIDGPVLTRDFQGDYDGSNSNVIVPRFSPVVALKSLSIDYNRNFTDASKLTEKMYFSRGSESPYQVQSQDLEVRLNGSDIVLRDDNESFIVGKIFAGSVLGSIRMLYSAGLGATKNELPGDLYQATLQLVCYWYFQEENRDIAVSSKGVRGESYTKVKGDIPEEIVDIVQRYKDYSFPNMPVMQRNQFSL